MTYEDLCKVNKEIKTMPIHGKDYAMAVERIKAFRKLYPEGFIKTEIISLENGVCVIKAEVGAGSTLLATGTAYEKEGSSNINKTSFIENCETSAVGRALGMLGIGIDGGLASYEEVANAKLNQEGPKESPKLKPITAEQMGELRPLMLKKGVPEEDICKRYQLKDITEMTDVIFQKCMSGLNKSKDKE